MEEKPKCRRFNAHVSTSQMLTASRSRGGLNRGSSSVRGRGRDALSPRNVSTPTKSSKSHKVDEAPRGPAAVDPYQRRE